MKLRNRILILLGIFVVALTLFYTRVPMHTYSNELKTVTASKATLPVVSFSIGGVEINPTLGYTFEPQAQLLHESLTPVGKNLDFDVLIDENESVVRRLVCKVYEVETETLLETKEVKALRRLENGRLSINVVLNGNYADDTEYICQLILTTNDGRDVFYYTRLVRVSYGNLQRDMDFIRDFHDSLLDDDRKAGMEKYLDTLDSSSGADFSHVTINDNIETVGYGTMAPKQLSVSIPTITEYNQTYVSATLDSRLQIFTNEAEETYSCHEEFRFRSHVKNSVLFNYDRTMQSEFDGTIVSINRNQVKLGLTPDTNVKNRLSANGKYLLFEYDGNLWEYDMTHNLMVKVFTFEKDDADDLRYTNRRHGFQLIAVEDNGNADFVFYGYISRGQYEGRVGLLYYRYFADAGRIEEMMFVPVTVSYEVLKEEFGRLCYMNDYDEFYFSLYDTLYLYRTLVHDFTVVVEHLPENCVLYENEGILVYQKEYSDAANTTIEYYDLENRTPREVSVADSERIRLLGAIDGDLVFGIAHAADVTFRDTGEDHVPMYKITIQTLEGENVKDYYRSNEFFSSAEVVDNAINIELCKKTGEATVLQEDGSETYRPLYESSGKYNILKSSRAATPKITVTGRSTNLMKREYYLNLPSGFKLEAIPRKESTVFTVLTGNTSVRVGTWIEPRYYVASYGRIIAVSGNLGECIRLADDSVGAVYDEKGVSLWKRGTKPESAKVKNITAVYAEEEGRTEMQAILQMFLTYKGSTADAATFDLNRKPFFTWLSEHIPGSAVDISGVTLAEALQFVAEGRPVAARYKDSWVMIVGYEPDRLTVISPTKGKKYTMMLSEAKATIAKTAVYYSYVD